MEKKKILYISFENSQMYTGGAWGNKSRIASLQEIVGVNNVDTLFVKPQSIDKNIHRAFKRIYNIIKGYQVGLDNTFIENMKVILSQVEYEYVFIDSSLLGCLCQKIKVFNKNIKTIVFFQNIEYDFFVSNTIDNKDFVHFFNIISAKYNEKKACKYADKIIVLNRKDYCRIQELYHKQADLIVPVTLPDDYMVTENAKNKKINKKCLNLLFIGSYFFGNTVGLYWFCHEILPKIKRNIHLDIVGSGMSKFAKNVQGIKRISIYDNVPDLTEYYENADLMIMPIKTGGGMKTKTAEALKFGKFIVGTTEALEGYEITPNCAITCNTTEDFINTIEHFSQKNKFNRVAYYCFKNNYSYKASADAIRKIL